MTTKIALREKVISGNRLAKYLDFYPPVKDPETGRLTRRKFLKLFLYSDIEYVRDIYHDDRGKEQIRYIQALTPSGNPRKIKLSATEELHNSKVQSLAESIKLKWMNELSKPEVYSGYELEKLRIKEQGQQDFLSYFRELVDKKRGSVYFSWDMTYIYLKKFAGDRLKIENLTERFCNDFKVFLTSTIAVNKKEKKLSKNSAAMIFAKFRAALKQGYKHKKLPENLAVMVEPMKAGETQRNYLTIEELNRLVKTECRLPDIKRAALFSALTGLRFSDIEKLVWSEIEEISGKYRIRFQQKKTGGMETMPISKQAFSLLPAKVKNGKVFEYLGYPAYYRRYLQMWVKSAGIDKKIVFHCFRHSYAVNQLEKGTDLFTVSKMLGHRNIQTTQVYAKITDKAKQKTIGKIKLDM